MLGAKTNLHPSSSLRLEIVNEVNLFHIEIFLQHSLITGASPHCSGCKCVSVCMTSMHVTQVNGDDKLNTNLACSGVQLRHTYIDSCERNDHTLFHYGFVQELAEPKMVAQDFPSGNLYDELGHDEKDYGVQLQHT